MIRFFEYFQNVIKVQIDNRPEAIYQRKMQDMANNSSRVMQLQAMQKMANKGYQSRSIFQRKESNNDNLNFPIQRKENKTGLPDNLKSGIENLSGHSMDDVKVHYNSDKPAQLQAHAYAQGTDIHLGAGQEKHLPHEAWHVVQQKQGRVKPTMQMKGKVNVNDDSGLEREADVMGAKALQRKKHTTIDNVNSTINSSIVQRTTPTETVTDYKDFTTLSGMSVVGLDRYAKKQADWHASPKLKVLESDRIRNILILTRNNSLLGSCGQMNVGDIDKEITSSTFGDVLRKLTTYSKAVTSSDPFRITQNPSVSDALNKAQHLDDLKNTFPLFMLKTPMKENIFNEYIRLNVTKDVINYYNTANPKPSFEATNGADYISYIFMLKKEGIDPIKYNGSNLKGKIKNFHRFFPKVLDQLMKNYNDTSKTKPLTLILHTSLDNSGAFHRDPELTNVIINRNINTLMIEGKDKLSGIRSVQNNFLLYQNIPTICSIVIL